LFSIGSPGLPELDVVVDGDLEKGSDGIIFARNAQKIQVFNKQKTKVLNNLSICLLTLLKTQMSCHSAGHPEPSLTLLKDGRTVLTSMGSIRHTFVATPSNNQTIWSCSAANKVAVVHGKPIMLNFLCKWVWMFEKQIKVN
jgi:hypothetical protein